MFGVGKGAFFSFYCGVCLAVIIMGLGIFDSNANSQTTAPARRHIRARPLKPPTATPQPTPTPVPASEEPSPLPSPTPVPPKLVEGSVEGSLVLTSGNTRTRNLGIASDVSYRPAAWEHLARANYISHSEQNEITAEKFTLELRGGKRLTERRDIFVDVYYLSNRFAGFDHQITPEVGTGYEWILADPVQLRTEIAAGYNFEDRTDGTYNNYLIGRVGVLFGWAISASSEFQHETSFLPAFNRLNNWRVRSETSVSASISARLAMKATYRYEFNNTPVDGKAQEDTSTLASIVARF